MWLGKLANYVMAMHRAAISPTAHPLRRSAGDVIPACVPS